MGLLSSLRSSQSHTRDASAVADGEAVAVEQLRSLLASRGLAAEDMPPQPDLLRFLRARAMNVTKASDFLLKDLAWRRENRIAVRSMEDASTVLGCNVSKLQAILPHACPGGVDKLGRPILFKHFGGQCELRKMLKETTEDKLHDYNWWLNEQYVRKLDELGAKKWVVIIDAKAWYPGLFDGIAFRFLKSMAQVDADHYPERLGAMIIINAPATLAFCWRVVRTWLDEETRRKIDIISNGSPMRARERILELAHPDQLPEQYCGNAAPLDAWPAWPECSGLPFGA
eukprot:scaffold230098_cov31-Tisochrysis_lutea.AAC.1